MRQYVIYFNPSDFPGRYVVRGWTAGIGECQPDAEPLGVVDNLEAARAKIPPGLHRLSRLPGEDSVIVETWL